MREASEREQLLWATISAQDTSCEPGHSHPVLLLCEIKTDQAGFLWLKKKSNEAGLYLQRDSDSNAV